MPDLPTEPWRVKISRTRLNRIRLDERFTTFGQAEARRLKFAANTTANEPCFFPRTPPDSGGKKEIHETSPHFTSRWRDASIRSNKWSAGRGGVRQNHHFALARRLERPAGGFIYFNHQKWFDANANYFRAPQNRGVGFVPQNYALFPHLTVACNVSYGLQELPAVERARLMAET